jgi:hypothetical protein
MDRSEIGLILQEAKGLIRAECLQDFPSKEGYNDLALDSAYLLKFASKPACDMTLLLW